MLEIDKPTIIFFAHAVNINIYPFIVCAKNFGQQRLLEAYVVLEEFIKELAAIVQAGVLDSVVCFID